MDKPILITAGTTETPIFFVHCGVGEIHYISALAPHIDSSIPVYALPAKLPNEARLRTIEGMASRLVKMLRLAQPSGPYRIVGWSTGGTLAYEIAAQLLGADQQVDFLGLIDTYCPQDPGKRIPNVAQESSPNDHLLLFIQSGLNCDDPKLIYINELRQRSHVIDFRTLVDKCRDLQLLPDLFNDFTIPAMEGWLARMRSYTLAAELYNPKVLSIPMHLFPAYSNDHNSRSSLAGWNEMIPESLLHVIPLDGTHSSVMAPGRIEDSGRLLSRSLRCSSQYPQTQARLTYSPLISLQSGKSVVEPLICIPGAGGSITGFLDLVSSLDRSQPIYGLQPRGLDRDLLPHSTVESTAAFYLSAVRNKFSSLPLHLLGHSFGGWVAFEIAHQLITSGLTVASLTLLDSNAPDNERLPMREYTDEMVTIEWIDVIEDLVGRSIGIPLFELQQHNQIQQRQLLHSCLVKEGLLPSRSDPESLIGPLQTFAKCLRTNYTPTVPYSGPVLLVLVDDRKPNRAANFSKHYEMVKGWRLWASNLMVTRTSGTHMTALKSPHVTQFSHYLRYQLTGTPIPFDKRFEF